MLSCVILASGLSRRMGTNKLLLKYKNQCIIENVLERVSGSKCFQEIIVVINDSSISDIINEYNVKTIWNENSAKGQSEAVKLGIKNLSKNSEGVAFFVGDQPLITEEVIKKISDEFLKEKKEFIIIPEHNGKRGNPVIFPKSTYSEFADLIGDVGGREIIKKNSNKIKLIKFNNSDIFRDIDTKEDYLSLIKGEGSYHEE